MYYRYIDYHIWKGFHLKNTTQTHIIPHARHCFKYYFIYQLLITTTLSGGCYYHPCFTGAKLSPREIVTCVQPHGKYIENCWSLSRVQLSVTPWTRARWAALSMEFSRQKYWGGLSFPSPYRKVGTKIQTCLILASLRNHGDWLPIQEQEKGLVMMK